MKELLRNALEFLESGEENLIKKRYNVSASDFFKGIVIFCDYIIYNEMKLVPKNHNERFSILERYFKSIYETVSKLFKTYTDSYNLRLNENDVKEVRYYAYELRNYIKNKK